MCWTFWDCGTWERETLAICRPLKYSLFSSSSVSWQMQPVQQWCQHYILDILQWCIFHSSTSHVTMCPVEFILIRKKKTMRQTKQAAFQELSGAETALRAHREPFFFWGLPQTGKHWHYGKINSSLIFASPPGWFRKWVLEKQTNKDLLSCHLTSTKEASHPTGETKKRPGEEGKVANVKPGSSTRTSSNHWKILYCAPVINSADKNCYRMSSFIYSI